MTNEQYHADRSAISKSGLDLIHRSPAHYYAAYLDPNSEPRTETEAMKIGTMVHTIILEPELITNYAVFNDAQIVAEIGGGNPRATNRYKEWKHAHAIENQGKIFVSHAEMESAKRMSDAVYSHPSAKDLLTDFTAEQTFMWVDPETGVKCKCRPDAVKNDGKIILDIKSTEDAGEAFAKSVFNYRYHVQAPFYMDGFEAATGIRPEWFIFIAVEKNPPYDVVVYYTPADVMEFGRNEYKNDLRRFKECQQSGVWPGYSNIVEPLKLPGWAMK